MLNTLLGAAKSRNAPEEGRQGEASRVRYSLRMELVESPVHTHCHFEVLQSSVFSYLVHHSSHACTTELGRTPGDHSAHLLHDDAVVTGALQPQVAQDGPDLQQGQAVTAREGDNDRSGVHRRSR